MRLPSLQFVATAVFALGFVLVSSGATSFVRVLMNDRPSWSVCGEDMCSCTPVDAVEPFCPLCEIKDGSVSGCPGESDGEPVRRVPKSDSQIDAMGSAASIMGSALFVTLVLGTREKDTMRDLGSDRWSVAVCEAPDSRSVGVPTPPPRG